MDDIESEIETELVTEWQYILLTYRHDWPYWVPVIILAALIGHIL